ncbi:MAG: hypothetical protein IT382_24775, partial [Deltaproteobacteria bacterium]|nr:hypothetical protein [Deltaproteobacteria bacterium]
SPVALAKPSAAAAPTAAAPSAAAPSAAAPAATGASVLPALLDVVAEKTGYPKDALNPSMALEADLGVDSIKRVEILSALKERVPSLPAVDAARMAQLHTLGEIAAALAGSEAASPGQPRGSAGALDNGAPRPF